MSPSGLRDGAILERVVRGISGICRVCGCEGDSCDIGGGEKCSWLPTALPRTLCNNPRCANRAAIDDKISKRKAKHGRFRKGRAA